MKLKMKGKVITAAAVSIVIATGLYMAADRYLIEHVEIDNVDRLTADSGNVSGDNAQTDLTGRSGLTTLDGQNSNVSQTGSSDRTGSANLYQTGKEDAAVGTAGSSSKTAGANDDWNYSDENSTVSVKKMTYGSGNDKVTYFVADIQLKNAMGLKSAFAKNEYGRNIVENTSVIAGNNNAVFAVNGDYYGFRDDGILIRNGVVFRDEPARTGLAFYKDGSVKIYDEKSTSAQELLDGGVWNTLSFGPALLVDSKVPSDITRVEVDTNFGNHSIQGSQPRTGIGMIDNNHFVVIVVDGRSTGYSRGVTLPEFADLFSGLGCTEAYNLDGGGSSTMYFKGRVVNNPQGRNRERGVSDILYVSDNS